MEDGHPAAAAPHGRPEASSPAGFGPLESFPSSSSQQTFDDNSLQLSEKNSFLATNYFASDSAAATPRHSPSLHSNNDSAQNVAPNLQLPPSLLPGGGSPASRSAQARSSPPVTSPTSLTHGLHHKEAIKLPAGNQQGDEEALSPNEKNDSQPALSPDLIRSPLQSLSLGSVHRRLNSISRAKTTYHLRMSYPRSPNEGELQKNVADFTGVEELGNQGRADKGGRDAAEEGDLSHEAGHQIEAVITSDEPMPHARSRKASHYLGLFKEKRGPPERKRSKDKHQEREREGILGEPLPVLSSLNRDSPDGVKVDLQQLRRSSSYEHPRHFADKLPARSEPPVEAPGLTRSSTETTAATPSLFSKDSVLTTDSEEEAATFSEDRVEWRSGEQTLDSLPFTLLEEIRSHRKEKTPKRPPLSRTGSSRAEKDDLRQTSAKVARATGGTPGSPFDYDAQVYEDEGDLEKERISSATYYPHQAPSPDTIAEHRHLDEAQLVKGKSKTTPLPPQTLDIDAVESEVIHESTDSAFNLQSKDRIQFIEKEYQSTTPGLDTGRSDYKWSTTSSASDTDYDSIDEGGRSDKDSERSRPDDGDTTPTATPHAFSYLQSRLRRGRKPLRAVELQPYKHQVGGHTKVFSFSKQAICKQLNNRENVFYEVIERAHRQLLDFLPKWVLFILTHTSIPLWGIRLQLHFTGTSVSSMLRIRKFRGVKATLAKRMTFRRLME